MADFGFYREVFLGTLSREQFQAVATRAREVLEQFKRIYTVSEPEPEAEKRAVCAMAEALAEFQEAGLRSASIGSVSVSYDPVDGKEQRRELLRRARVYLDIYRGVCG